LALEDGFEPPASAVSMRSSYPLSYSSRLHRLDPTPGVEPGHCGFAGRRLPTWQGRALAPGERLERSSHGSEPGVLPARRPWCDERPGSGAPRRIRTSTAFGHGVTARWARWCPSRRADTARCRFGLPCLFGFQSAFDFGTKEKGPGACQTLCGCSHQP
jgi:hypothetical protein